MRCPICKSQIMLLKLTESTYRIECISIMCDYVDEFEYVAPVVQGNLLRQVPLVTA